MDVIALVVSILALLGAAAGFIVQRRDRKTDRAEADEAARDAGERADRAQQTADEATASARRSAEAAERMAKALEAQALAAAQDAPTPQVAWTLAHYQADAYLLTNVGSAVAYDVNIDTGDLARVRTPTGAWPRAEMPPDDAAKVLALRTLATKDDTVAVTWASEPGGVDRKTWSRPLPPRPPVIRNVDRP